MVVIYFCLHTTTTTMFRRPIRVVFLFGTHWYHHIARDCDLPITEHAIPVFVYSGRWFRRASVDTRIHITVSFSVHNNNRATVSQLFRVNRRVYRRPFLYGECNTVCVCIIDTGLPDKGVKLMTACASRCIDDCQNGARFQETRWSILMPARCSVARRPINRLLMPV